MTTLTVRPLDPAERALLGRIRNAIGRDADVSYGAVMLPLLSAVVTGILWMVGILFFGFMRGVKVFQSPPTLLFFVSLLASLVIGYLIWVWRWGRAERARIENEFLAMARDRHLRSLVSKLAEHRAVLNEIGDSSIGAELLLGDRRPKIINRYFAIPSSLVSG